MLTLLNRAHTFPAWRYHRDHPPVIVKSALEESRLDDGWQDLPIGAEPRDKAVHPGIATDPNPNDFKHPDPIPTNIPKQKGWPKGKKRK